MIQIPRKQVQLIRSIFFSFVLVLAGQTSSSSDDFQAKLREYLNGTPTDSDTEKRLAGPFILKAAKLMPEISQAIKRNAKNPRAYFLSGFVHVMKQNMVEAESAFTKAIELHAGFRPVAEDFLHAVKRGKQSKTMVDLRAIGTALELYRIDHKQFPLQTGGSLNKMAGKLEPEYIQKLPLADDWGNEIQYFCLPPGNEYWIISFGQDHIQDQGIYDSDGVPSAAGKGIVHNFDSDLIYNEGVSFRYPEGKQKGALRSIDEAAAVERRHQQREEERVKKEAGKLTSLSKRFPRVEDLEELHSKIQAEVNSLTITDFTRDTKMNKGFYDVSPISMKVSGDYLKLLEYLDRVAALEKIVLIDAFSIQGPLVNSATQDSTIQAQLSFDTFTLSKDFLNPKEKDMETAQHIYEMETLVGRTALIARMLRAVISVLPEKLRITNLDYDYPNLRIQGESLLEQNIPILMKSMYGIDLFRTTALVATNYDKQSRLRHFTLSSELNIVSK